MKDKITFTIKDVIYIVTLLGGMFAGYYANKYKVSSLEEKVNGIEQTLKENNLELINYKLDEILKLLDK